MISFDLHSIVRLIKPNILFAALTAFVHCLLTFKSSWTMTPRPKSRSSETLDNYLPNRQYFALLLSLPKCNTWHLSVLNNIIQSSDQLARLWRSLVTISWAVATALMSLVSSANLSTLDRILSSMSFMYIRNNTRPETKLPRQLCKTFWERLQHRS